MLWDLETGEAIRKYQGHDAPVANVVFGPEGDFGISSSLDGTVRIWHIHRTVDELVEWLNENRYVRELTCEE